MTTPLPEDVLIAFLKDRMSMTDVYQPAVIKDLLLHDGRRSKTAVSNCAATPSIWPGSLGAKGPGTSGT